MKRITSYQALWKSLENQGHFWFTYADGEQERTADLDAKNFQMILEMLGTQKPIFADRTTSTVELHGEVSQKRLTVLLKDAP
ncbi:MAG: hypothetical protein RID53_19685 [Coleofasciculus sp. B1-GNL1-01]|uniref:hypothetical protein n=1 Tax=Coleofasciculus sp. B1-GNL1-01 TaxID=3068484 RepID=UPI0032F2874E